MAPVKNRQLLSCVLADVNADKFNNIIIKTAFYDPTLFYYPKIAKCTMHVSIKEMKTSSLCPELCMKEE